MKKYTVSKKYSFEAAHALDRSWLPEGHPCIGVHGHSYVVEVGYSRWSLDRRGFAGADYKDIDKAIEPLIKKCDHTFLNDWFPQKTTAEHIAGWFFDNLEKAMKDSAKIDFVNVYETARTCVRVTKDNF